MGGNFLTRKALLCRQQSFGSWHDLSRKQYPRFSVASQFAPAQTKKKVICYQWKITCRRFDWMLLSSLGQKVLAKGALITKSFSWNVGKLFSELNLVTDNLPLHHKACYAVSNPSKQNVYTRGVFSLVPRPHKPPSEKRSDEWSRISWACYPKRVMTNEIARSVIALPLQQ